MGTWWVCVPRTVSQCHKYMSSVPEECAMILRWCDDNLSLLVAVLLHSGITRVRPKKGLGWRCELIPRYCDRLVDCALAITVFRLFRNISEYDEVLHSNKRIVLPIGVLRAMALSTVLIWFDCTCIYIFLVHFLSPKHCGICTEHVIIHQYCSYIYIYTYYIAEWCSIIVE